MRYFKPDLYYKSQILKEPRAIQKWKLAKKASHSHLCMHANKMTQDMRGFAFHIDLEGSFLLELLDVHIGSGSCRSIDNIENGEWEGHVDEDGYFDMLMGVEFRFPDDREVFIGVAYTQFEMKTSPEPFETEETPRWAAHELYYTNDSWIFSVLFTDGSYVRLYVWPEKKNADRRDRTFYVQTKDA